MKYKLLCYSLKGMSPVERMKFQRKMYGFKDMSNHGKYTYRRKGILDTIPHKKILDCVIVVKTSDSPIVTKLLRKFHAKIHEFDISSPFKF